MIRVRVLSEPALVLAAQVRHAEQRIAFYERHLAFWRDRLTALKLARARRHKETR